jgi:hypothetical protein
MSVDIETRSKVLLRELSDADCIIVVVVLVIVLVVLVVLVYNIGHSGQYYKLFTAAIMPLAVYFSMNLTELCRYRRNNIGHRGGSTAVDH